MASTPHPIRDQIICNVCGISLDPDAPASPTRQEESLSSQDEDFFCIDCWLRSLRSQTAESEQARRLDRVFAPIDPPQPL